MRKGFMILGCLTVAMVGTMLPVQAGPVPCDGAITMAAADTSATTAVALTAGSYDIDRIVFYNSVGVTSAVSVAMTDVGVETSVASFALAASGGSSQRPRGYDVYGTTTNAYRYTARDLVIKSYKPTNATDVVIFYRILFAGD